MSWICHRDKLVFIHNERTGGKSFTEWARRGNLIDVEFPMHDDIRTIQLQGYRCPGYVWKMVVRNPFDRCVSWYEEHKAVQKMPFEVFVRDVYVPKQLQVNKLNMIYPVELSIPKFETATWYGLPHHNKSENRKPYQEYYTDEIREMVEIACEIDFKSFGYKWEDL